MVGLPEAARADIGPSKEARGPARVPLYTTITMSVSMIYYTNAVWPYANLPSLTGAELSKGLRIGEKDLALTASK